jgi:hypothetical protein
LKFSKNTGTNKRSEKSLKAATIYIIAYLLPGSVWQQQDSFNDNKKRFNIINTTKIKNMFCKLVFILAFISGYQCYLSPSIVVNSLNSYQLHRESSGFSNGRTHSYLRDLAALQSSTHNSQGNKEYDYGVKIDRDFKSKRSLTMVRTTYMYICIDKSVYIYIYIHICISKELLMTDSCYQRIFVYVHV